MQKAFFKLSFLYLLFAFPLFSSGPVFHLWVAEKFCEVRGIEKGSNGQGYRPYIIGVEFPDIRYRAQLARELTHPIVFDVKEILDGKTPFETGMRIHAWHDAFRERNIQKEVYEAIKPYCEDQKESWTLLKLIEEEILADIYDGRSYNDLLSCVLEEELALVKEEIIWNWHKSIQYAIAFRPSWLFWAQSFRGPAFGISPQKLYEWSYLLPKLKDEPLFKDHLLRLLSLFEAELEKIQAS